MKQNKMDYPLLVVTLILVSFGLLMVFSSSYYYAIDKMQNKLHFFTSDLNWIVLGVFAMLVASAVDYKIYRKVAIPLFVVSMFLLVYVLFKGTVVNDARRWITIAGQRFQPAEVAKIGLIMFFAFSLEKNYTNLNKPKILAVYVAIIGAVVLLVMKQPNMSTAVILAGVMAVMLFVAGLRWIYVISFAVAGGAVGWLLVHNAPYRLNRMIAFLDPFKYKNDESWQVIQSLYALGTGGIFGVGLGMSTQNKLYIPEPQNDFILATVGEELGLIGTVGLLILFLILLYRCVKIAMNAPDIFSTLLATGISTMLGLQILMNYAVATSSMPATGVTLPFISYGGTSISILLGSIGIMLNISKATIKRTHKNDD
ncbi:putative lipid II flippase FtsW [Fusibacter bizertensis]